MGEILSPRQVFCARLVGASEAMQRVLWMVERAAQSSVSVLIIGENETGRELLARILHHASARRLSPFVAVNCAEWMLGTELFGIHPNAATGAPGLDGAFVRADGGTLLLEEIGELPPKEQFALLRAMECREITPVGSPKPIPVDVRIVSATKVDLRRLVSEHTFDPDLLFHLHVVPIHVPPPRDRKADVHALARHFVANFTKSHEPELPELSAEFIAALLVSDLPGNVRELRNYIERATVNPGKELDPDPLPDDGGSNFV